MSQDVIPKLKGQAARGEQKRAAIVDAALQVFARVGFRAGAVAEVAALVGSSVAGVYYHFGSKEALLVEVLRERDRRLGTSEWAVPPHAGISSLRKLVLLAQEAEQQPGLVALHSVLQMESLHIDAPAHEHFKKRNRLLRDWARKTLEAAQAAGDVREDVDPAAVAVELVAFVEGSAVQWLVDPAAVPLSSLYANYIEMLLRDIGTPAGAARRVRS